MNSYKIGEPCLCEYSREEEEEREHRKMVREEQAIADYEWEHREFGGLR